MKLHARSLVLPSLILGLAGCPADDEETDDIQDPTEYPTAVDCSGNPCVITGVLDEDFELTADKDWLLDGPVAVGEDKTTCVNLDIEAGTTIFGATGKRSFLVVHRCSTINAIGTAAEPIVFTSAKEDGERNPGDWGGLLLNGEGLHNQCSDPNDCNVDSEGGEEAGQYGGNDNNDDKGTLEYVRVEFAGDQVTEDDQLNGIAFQAVGSDSVFDYLQIHRNKDDGVEFFGGAAEVKHLIVTGAHDDQIDWTSGWTGKIQHAVAVAGGDLGERGIEADNNEDNNAASPVSQPTLSHVTLIGSPSNGNNADGMKLRRGTGANLYSMLVVGWADDCIDIDSNGTYSQAIDPNGDLNGVLTIQNSIIGDCGNLYKDRTGDGAAFTGEDWYETMNGTSNRTVTSTDEVVEDRAPFSGAWVSKGVATSGGASPNDAWFDAGTHVGGIAPGDNWAAGWIQTAEN